MNNEEKILSILESMQTRMDTMQGSMDSIQTEMQSVKTEVQGVKTDMRAVQTEVKTVQVDLQTVKTEVSSIKLTLENETNRNIAIIAEGHLDIIRKLDDALKVENEKELMLVRMNRMENEIRLLKEQVQRLA